MNKEDHTFDLIVIGTGTAASTTASECRYAGWSVAIIDSLLFGGTCALRGCDDDQHPEVFGGVGVSTEEADCLQPGAWHYAAECGAGD